MTISQTSRAAGNATSINNVKFAVSAEVLPRKQILIGTFDPLKTLVVPEVPVLLTSPEDAGAKYEFGTMLHRLAVAAFAGNNGVETWAVPQDEAAASVAADGSIDYAGSTLTESGTYHLYIAGLAVPVNLTVGDDGDAIAIAVAAAITADTDLPVTGVVDGVTTSQVNLEAKSTGPWGNVISITFNWGFKEETPAGLTQVVTTMTNGAGIPDIQGALDALGTGDLANENGYTDLNHGYGIDTGTQDALSTWNGLGNTKTGLYANTVHRPLRVLDGDVTVGSGGLSTLLALGEARRATDRTNGVIAAPGSPRHPMEIAAIAMGIMANINNNRAEESYVGQTLPGVIPGNLSDMWTADYDERDTAVKAGISPTLAKGSALKMQNVMTFYHPTDVSINSNIYASQRNISITQNILAATNANFDREKWRGFTIVADVTAVSNIVSRQKARDVSAVLDDAQQLAFAFEGNAWIFTAAYTISRFQSEDLISIRPGGLGFNLIFPVYYSGEGGILATEIQADLDITALV